jgi:pilus assembly protein Flp/PilA
MTSNARKAFEQVRRLALNCKGQGLVEYALILVLIAIVVIAAVKGLGTSSNSVFSTINSSIVNP